MNMTQSSELLRIDKWLWAARFFKTRALAVKALKSGHVKLLEQNKKKNLKPATEIKIGQTLEIQRGPFQFTITVDQLSKHRGSATIAAQLFTETKDSIKARESVKSAIRAQPKNPYGGRKPDKHTIRKNRDLKRGF